MNYNNGTGNIPRLPDRVVDTLIDSAGVSRCASGRTATTVRDQSAEVERLVHDACEELLARLPAAVPASEPVAPEPIDADMIVLLLREGGIINERGAMRLLNGDFTPFTLDGLVQVVNLACKAAPALPIAPEPAQQSAPSAGKDTP